MPVFPPHLVIKSGRKSVQHFRQIRRLYAWAAHCWVFVAVALGFLPVWGSMPVYLLISIGLPVLLLIFAGFSMFCIEFQWLRFLAVSLQCRCKFASMTPLCGSCAIVLVLVIFVVSLQCRYGFVPLAWMCGSCALVLVLLIFGVSLQCRCRFALMTWMHGPCALVLALVVLSVSLQCRCKSFVPHILI